MDIGKILADLRRERDQLAEAIQCLERLALGAARRRGRPPAWMSRIKQDGGNADRPAGRKAKKS